MKFELKSFRTKVARRIFLLFVTCAIVPILVTAWISFRHVSRQIREQGFQQLYQGAKTVGISLFERLSLLRAEIRIIASTLSASGPARPPSLSEDLANRIRERFTSLALLEADGRPIPLLGEKEVPSDLTGAEMAHLREGKALLRLRHGTDVPPDLFMYVPLDPDDPESEILAAEINRTYLWQAAEGRPPGMELFILDDTRHVLYCSVPGKDVLPRESLGALDRGHSGRLEWETGKRAFLASYWAVFLKPNFMCPEWIILLRQPREEALAPMIDFKRAFPVIILISLGVVLLMSISLIRKNMGPIEILREATRKIAGGGFGHRVEIKSGDEFETLGESFNEMSEKLKEGQDLLVQAARLSAMGQMAAGVVHEINQPLTAISGLLQLILVQESSAEKRTHIETALAAVERLNSILARFRTFARVSREKVEPLSLKQVVLQVYTLLEHQFKMKRIHCRIHVDDDLPPVMGDPQGLHQVFSNLLINAMQALEDKEEGERNLDIRIHAAGHLVHVEIEDNGCGIPEEVRERIFDPFFTTKGPDRGTGLGMVIVESILHKHEAKITVKSEVNVGSTFTITFPAVSSGNPRPSPAPTAP
ncbi:MAG: HAMP domain-containing protein [Deltaproteobacteria bacterium]|nr:HAMP domain-containing protein [Deltaproteobacteria bacterium]